MLDLHRLNETSHLCRPSSSTAPGRALCIPKRTPDGSLALVVLFIASFLKETGPDAPWNEAPSIATE